MRSFYQDRLGTSTGKTQKQNNTIFSGVSISGGQRNRFIGNDVYDVGTHLSTSGGAENKKRIVFFGAILH